LLEVLDKLAQRFERIFVHSSVLIGHKLNFRLLVFAFTLILFSIFIAINAVLRVLVHVIVTSWSRFAAVEHCKRVVQVLLALVLFLAIRAVLFCTFLIALVQIDLG